MKKYPEPTEKQRAALKMLRARFAEKGFHVTPVHNDYRRHESDFVIFPKDDQQQFSIVRAAGAFVVVRPFGVRRNDVIKIVKDVRKKLPAPLMHAAAPLLPYKKGSADLWKHFVAPEAHDEIFELSHRISE